MVRESWASSQASRNTMRANPGKDTRAELVIRSMLHSHGLRFRVNYGPIAGLRRTADIVFTRKRIAVFVDGCFWHGCPLHYIAPKANAEFWRQKVEGNRARDVETTTRFKEAGWHVIRAWEHEAPEDVVRLIERAVRRP